MKSTSSFPGPNASRRPSRLGDILAQTKIDEARRLIPEQRLLIAPQHFDAGDALRRAGCKKRYRKLPGLKTFA